MSSNPKHPAILACNKHVHVATLSSSGAVAEAVSRAISWKSSLECTSERHVSVSIGAYHWLSINLSTQGKFEESYGIIQSALKLDPNNHVILMNSSLPARKLGYYLIAETNTKLGLSLSPNYLLNWLSLYQTYLDQENKENEIKSLILDVESISDKDRNIYDLLVHYYWKKDKNKFESYLSAARSYIDNETRGEHNLDYYLITEGKLDDLLLTANQRFKDGRFNYNFCSNIFISDFFNDKKVASLIKLIQAGKD